MLSPGAARQVDSPGEARDGRGKDARRV